MRKLYPFLRVLLVTFLVLGIGLSLIGDCISGLLFEGNSCSIKGSVSISLWTYGPYFLVLLLLLLALFIIARHDHLQYAALRQFSFVKSIKDLRPEDFGFQETMPDKKADLGYRPFYEAYVPRSAIPARNFPTNANIYDESALTEVLRSGDSFVLLGPPLSGKSRTVYEVLKSLKDYVAIAPERAVGLPDKDAFVKAIKGKKIVLILEDLSDYVASDFPLREFVGRLSQHVESWALAATCRDGPEMAVIEAAQGTDMGRFYEEIHLKLRLELLTAEEKESLAREIGKEWSASQSDMYPTPGSIVMEDSIHAMQSRFEHALSLEQKDILRSLQLLAFANVRPFTHDRIRRVLEHPDLFDRTSVHLRDCLETLTEQAFLNRPAMQDSVDLEPAYLLDAVEYADGKNPVEDFPILVEILDNSADADGLLYIAYIYKEAVQDRGWSMYCLEKALKHKPDFPEALNNTGTELADLGRHDDALGCYRRALKLRPGYTYALDNMARSLSKLGRYAEAIYTCDQVIGSGYPHEDDTWCTKGIAFSRFAMDIGVVEAQQEAIVAFDEALRITPDNVGALHGKGVALDRMGKPEEALVSFSKALELNAGCWEVWFSKGVTLQASLKRPREALRAYARSVRLNPNDAEAWSNMSVVLFDLERYKGALAAAERSAHANPMSATAWFRKGVALTELGCYAESIVTFEEAENRGFDRPEVWYGKGVALERWGYRHEAARWLYSVCHND